MKNKLEIPVTTVSESPIWAPGLIYVSEEEKKKLIEEQKNHEQSRTQDHDSSK